MVEKIIQSLEQLQEKPIFVCIYLGDALLARDGCHTVCKEKSLESERRENSADHWEEKKMMYIGSSVRKWGQGSKFWP